MKIKIKQILPDAIAPTYESAGAGCFDFRAMGLPEGGVVVTPGTPQIIRTGLSFEIPMGWVMEIHSRSGHGFKFNVRLANCEGQIDSDYRGEVMVKLASDGGAFPVKNGDRIAQGKLVEAHRIEFEFAEVLSETERGEGGFGSTDLKKLA